MDNVTLEDAQIELKNAEKELTDARETLFTIANSEHPEYYHTVDGIAKAMTRVENAKIQLETLNHG